PVLLSAVIAATLLAAWPASAQVGADFARCRSSIAKAYGKFIKATTKTIARCHKERDRDVALAATDCNDAGTVFAMDDHARARTKLVDAVSRACEAQDSLLTAANVGGGREFYVSCPVPSCAGVTDPLDTMAEVGGCLACLAESTTAAAAADTLGSPDPAALDANERRCRGAIAKGYAKYFSTGLKSESACQKDRDEEGNDALDACTNTMAGDPKGRTARALAQAAAGLDKTCTTPLADIDGCSAVDVDSLKTCTAAAWSAAEDVAFTGIYELPALGCPAAIRVTVLAGCSTEGSAAGTCSSGFETATTLSLGWKGGSHGIDLPDSVTLAIDLTCPGSEIGSCGTCTSTGVSEDSPQAAAFTRCVGDPSIECSNPFGTDPACNGLSGGACRPFLGPPLNVAGGGVPLCTLTSLGSDIVDATVDPDAGAADVSLETRARVHLGASQTRPCPYCRDDITAQDGQTDGTCFGGPRDGMPCDVQGFDLTFAPVDDELAPTSGVSLDCPPSPGLNISGTGLATTLPLTTGTSTKSAEDACEAPNELLDCFCGVCSGNKAVSCNNDTECSLLALGSCESGSSAGGAERKPNNCTDGICYPVPGQADRGVCSSDIAMVPTEDAYCSGVRFASGKPILSCAINADCNSWVTGSIDPDDWVCPSDDCGTCTEVVTRSCFLDPIEISGEADPVSPQLAATFCVPTTSGSGVNAAIGLPGPGVIRADTRIELRY
ncbi:MAG: hypothetical protein ABR587_07025, partial [Candidatus Binatia bacterium]